MEELDVIMVIDEVASTLQRGERKSIPCPEKDCNDGILTIQKSDYNGHMMAKCDKCGLKVMQ